MDEPHDAATPTDDNPGNLGLYSAIATALMFCLFGPAVFGLSVVLTEGDEALGALSFLLGGPLVIVLQIVAMVLAILGFKRRERRRKWGILTFVVGALVILAMLALSGAALVSLL